MTRTGRARFSENMNTVVFSWIKSELSLIKQTTLKNRDLLTEIDVINV